MNIVLQNTVRPSPKDYASDQEVRWCPGCGDYAILRAIQKTFADLALPNHGSVFVSGIGCSSRLPYYMATYGFHTIHGRAPAVATGIKLASPDLDVWVVTGDGDGLSIGGNHLMHVLRRNVDVQILLFNNEIYGLTKGQYSPTSRIGTRSPSSPAGSLDRPMAPAQLALGAAGRFVARAVDVQQKPLVEVLKRAQGFRGAAFVEIFQNCIVFNDGAFEDFLSCDAALDRQVQVEHGKPIVFGKDGGKGLRLRPGTLKLEIVELAGRSPDEAGVLVHDEADRTLAMLLADLEPPMPVVLGVLYCSPKEVSYEAAVLEQAGGGLRSEHTASQIAGILNSGPTWKVIE
jgi:2-oxoglutarate ferredoxin oxidoreductase subunit beta